MSEVKATEIGNQLIQKQINLAQHKKNKGDISGLVKLEAEVVNLKREFNQELDKISQEAKVRIVSTGSV